MSCTYMPPPLVHPEIVSFKMPLYMYDALPTDIIEFLKIKNLQPTGRFILMNLMNSNIAVPVDMLMDDFLELQSRYSAFKKLEYEHLGRS